MAEMYLNGNLNVPWEVVLTVTDTDNTDTSFSLQPKLKGEEITLVELHQDLENIANHLRHLVIEKAEQLSEHASERPEDRIDQEPNRGFAKLFDQLRAGDC